MSYVLCVMCGEEEFFFYQCLSVEFVGDSFLQFVSIRVNSWTEIRHW